jgi:hypothetical protein
MYFDVRVIELDPVEHEWCYELCDVHSPLVIKAHQRYDDDDEALRAGVSTAEEINGAPFADDHLFQCRHIDLAAEGIQYHTYHVKKPSAAQQEHRIPATCYGLYRDFGGQIDERRFHKLLKAFLCLTQETYTDGDVSPSVLIEAELRGVPARSAAAAAWEDFMRRVGHDPNEAKAIFNALDRFCPYS